MPLSEAPAPAARPGRSLGYGLLFVVVMSLPRLAAAQVTGQNVNMVAGTKWPGGDPFLQRQNEPSLDVSTRNTLHLLAGANDYRTVDLQFADQLPAEGNAGDAWLGLFKSFDGGRTWQSTLLPGYPQDQSADGLASPLKGYAAGADPTVRAGTNGLFYYSGIAFNRVKNGSGVLFLALFIDNNNKENGDATLGRDPIKYVRTVVVRQGNAGQFLDKPTLAVDVPRAGAGACTIVTAKDGGGTLTQTVPAGRVYLAWTEFVGGDVNIRTKVYVAVSTNCGATFGPPVKVSEGYPVNQGAALAIDPATGYVYVAWRRFPSTNQTSAILVARSTDGGQKFSSPVEVVSLPAYDAAKPAAPTFFDQGTTSGSFRTNAYPALAVDGSGRLYLAWSQRGAGAGSDARVVLSTSADGTTWSTPSPIDNGLVLDDEGNPFDPYGLTGCGHQLMPALKFAAGKLMVVYYDLRLDQTIGIFTPTVPAPSPAGLFFKETRLLVGETFPNPAVFTPFITDANHHVRRHTLDVRVAQAVPAAFPAFTSARASRYVFGSRPGQTRIEQLQINPPNLPMFVQGTAPFMGDYIDIAGAPPFVPRPDGTWVYNTAPAGDVLFHAAWTDNRDVRPPMDGNWANYTPVGSTGGPSVFDPAQRQPNCADGQTGMRNQNVYTSSISQGLVVSTPFNAKPLTTAFARVFVTVVRNTTEFVKSYRLAIASQPPDGKASFLRDPIDGQTYPLTTLDVSIAPRSSISRPVFVTSSAKYARVTVNVAEITAPAGSPVAGGLTGAVVFNPDVSNPDVSNPDVSNPDVSNPDVSNVEVYTPDVSNPDVSNPDVSNPDVSNPDVSNPDVSNPDVSNPDVSNPDVSNPDVSNPDVSNPDVSNPDVSNPDVSNMGLTDANYRIRNDGNTAGTYRIRLIGNPAGAKLQLILSKVYATPVAVGCTLREQPQNTLVANIIHPVFNPDVSNPDVSNPDVSNPDVSNATMALAPGESGLITLRGSVGKGQAGIDAMKKIVSETTPVVVPHAPASNAPPNTPPTPVSPLFITTSALPNATAGTPYSATVQAMGGKLSYAYAASGLPNGLSINGATGVISGTPAGPAGTASVVVTVTDGTTPAPRIASRTLPLRVIVAGPPTLVVSAAPTDVVGGQAFTLRFRVQDSGGGPVPGATVSLALASTGCSAAGLSGDLSAVSDVTGNVQFTNVRIDRGGEGFRIRAASGAAATLTGPIHVEGFCATGSAARARTLASLTRLADGRVLLAGGMDPGNSEYLDTAEIYDPATGLFSLQTGRLIVARQGHKATLLPDGKVLIVGGRASDGTYTRVAELFDPAAGTFSATAGQPGIGRYWFTATWVPSAGKVLITGGGATGGPMASAELYDPEMGTFSPTGSMSDARWLHAATLLADGGVLVTGGVGAEIDDLTSAEVWDPAAGTFGETAPLLTGRRGHGAIALPDGRVLVVGGMVGPYSSQVPLASTEIYDPDVPAFTSGSPMSVERHVPLLVPLSSGKILVAGGIGYGIPPTEGVFYTLGTAEIYDSASDTFAPTGSARPYNADSSGAVRLETGKVLITGTWGSPAAEQFYPSGGYTLAGRILWNNTLPIASKTSNAPTFFAGDQSTGRATTIASTFDPATSLYSMSRILPDTIYFEWRFVGPTSLPGGSPGDYVVYEGNLNLPSLTASQRSNHTLNAHVLMRLRQPLDNSVNCSVIGRPAYASPLAIEWDPVADATQYGVTVRKLLGNTQTWSGFQLTATTSTAMTLDATGPGEWYQLWVIAYSNTGAFLGSTQCSGSDGYGPLPFVVTPQPPDLTVTLTHYPPNPTDLDLITATATVTNSGAGAAGPSWLELCVGGETPGPTGTCRHTLIPALAPGQSWVDRREDRLTSQGYRNHATADYLSQVVESNEGNNLAIDDYVVAAATGGVTFSGTVYYSTGGLAGVTVELGQEPGNVNPPLRRTSTDGTGSYSFNLISPGTYWVKAYGPTPAFIGSVEPSNITVAGVPVIRNIDLPKIITLSQPQNAATGVSLTPTLTWSAIPESARYMVQISTTSPWTTVAVLNVGNVSSYTVPSGLLVNGTNYTWHVGGYDGSGHNVGESGMSFTFTTSP